MFQALDWRRLLLMSTGGVYALGCLAYALLLAPHEIVLFSINAFMGLVAVWYGFVDNREKYSNFFVSVIVMVLILNILSSRG